MRSQTQVQTAIRVQRCRERQTAGLSVRSIEIQEDATVALLIAEGLLDPIDSDNRNKIDRALELRLLGELYTKGYLR